MADITVYGAPWCPDCRRAKQFLNEQRIPYDWVDIDADPAGLAWVERLQDGGRTIPTIVCADGSYLLEPSNAELAEKLGLELRADRSAFDLIIVGGGPARPLGRHLRRPRGHGRPGRREERTRPAQAEWHALECLFPVIERRRGGEPGVRQARALAGDALWDAAGRGEWSWDLLGAALSRSDTPQGDSVTDGRTQDLVGLGQVQKLPRSPRGWLLDHHDGFRSALLVLDGVVADYNFAVRLPDGGTVFAQIHRPPPPPDHQYSRLAAAVESFLLGGNPPWSAERPLAIAETAALLAATAR